MESGRRIVRFFAPNCSGLRMTGWFLRNLACHFHLGVDEAFDRFAADEVLLDDFDDLSRGHVLVPQPVGLDDHRRPGGVLAGAAEPGDDDIGQVARLHLVAELLKHLERALRGALPFAFGRADQHLLAEYPWHLVRLLSSVSICVHGSTSLTTSLWLQTVDDAGEAARADLSAEA